MDDDTSGGPTSLAASLASVQLLPGLLGAIAEDPKRFGYPSVTSEELLRLAMYFEYGAMDTDAAIQSEDEALFVIASIAERMAQDRTFGGSSQSGKA